jgi:hypothetical protein
VPTEINHANMTAAMEASAKAIGIGVNELADMITQQQTLNKFKQEFNVLDKETVKNSKNLTEIEKKRLLDGTAGAAEYYKFAKEQGKDLNAILGEQAITSLEAQDAQSKFNDSLEKAKETFSRFVDGEYLDKLANVVADLAEYLSKGGSLFSALTGIGDSGYQQLKETNKEARMQEKLDKVNEKYNAKSLTPGTAKYDEYVKEFTQAQQPQSMSVQDFVIKPLKKDTITMAGGTKLGGDTEKLLSEQNQLLRDILSETKHGKNVSVDLNKLNTSISDNQFQI